MGVQLVLNAKVMQMVFYLLCFRLGSANIFSCEKIPTFVTFWFVAGLYQNVCNRNIELVGILLYSELVTSTSNFLSVYKMIVQKYLCLETVISNCLQCRYSLS